MKLTTDSLIRKVRRSCFWPTASEKPITNAALLEIAEEVIRSEMWPQMVQSQGDYVSSYEDSPILSGVAKYRVPARTFGPITAIVEVQTDGTEADMPLISLSDLGKLDQLWSARTRTKYTACVDGDYVRLVPTPEATQGLTLRVRYFREPNELCLEELSATVLFRGTVGGDDAIAFATDPSALWDLTDTDFISAGGSHGVLIEGADASVTNVLGLFVATRAAVDFPDGWGDVQAGDYMCAAGTTPIVQLPDVMQPLLIARTSANCLETAGDLDNSLRKNQKAGQLYTQLEPILTPRTDKPAYVKQRNSAFRAR